MRRLVSAAVLLCTLALPALADVPLSQIAPENAPNGITVAKKDEPGERLMVEGVITDGTNPLKGVSIYVYQTDAEGKYAEDEKTPGAGADHPRLRGLMRTDMHGQYAFDTIRPASYPNTPLPAHVHYVVTAKGFKDKVFEIWFEGDPKITPAHRKAQAEQADRFYIEKPFKDGRGIWHVTHDVVMERN